MPTMRTTVTLDPDVERVLRTAMRERGFVQKTYSLGSEQHFRWDKALAVSEAIKDEELSRELTLRK